MLCRTRGARTLTTAMDTYTLHHIFQIGDFILMQHGNDDATAFFSSAFYLYTRASGWNTILFSQVGLRTNKVHKVGSARTSISNRYRNEYQRLCSYYNWAND